MTLNDKQRAALRAVQGGRVALNDDYQMVSPSDIHQSTLNALERRLLIDRNHFNRTVYLTDAGHRHLERSA